MYPNVMGMHKDKLLSHRNTDAAVISLEAGPSMEGLLVCSSVGGLVIDVLEHTVVTHMWLI